MTAWEIRLDKELDQMNCIIKLLSKLLDIPRFMVHGSKWKLGTHEVAIQYIKFSIG